MPMPQHNAFYAQSGGVTAVINASAAGVIETARQHPAHIGTVYAGRHGILGALTEELIDTSQESAAALARLTHTPGGAFGSARYQLPRFEDNLTNQSRAQGRSRRDALIHAGSTRLRPIVMTTLAMIFGMLPLAFAIGAGAEMRAPMARAVIGGLITSTLLTLIVVPVVYTYLDDLRPAAVVGWFKWPKRRRADAGAPETGSGAPASQPAD